MEREVRVRGTSIVCHLLDDRKKKLVRKESDRGGHTVYVFNLDDDDIAELKEFTEKWKKRNYF